MKLNVKAFALAAGILWGVAILVITLSDVWCGRGEHLILLRGIYPGYQISYLGSVIGLVYGFVSGALVGALFAWLYNCLNKEA
jgi:prepilin signal peptidase PulO-like enzyme (type II secretory pathway)